MSRKKGARPRTPTKPELAEPASDDELSLERGTTYTLTGEPRRLLDAIINGRAVLAAASEYDDIGDVDDIDDTDDADELDDTDGDDDFVSRDWRDDEGDDDDDADDDPASEEIDPVSAMVLTTYVLARALLDQVIGASPKRLGADATPDDDDAPGIDGGILDLLTTNLLPPNAPPTFKQSREEREAMVDDVSLLICEVGLEEFDVYCELEILRDGTSYLYVTPVTPEHAHVALLERVFERAEDIATGDDPLLALERDASAWEFGCWNIAPPPGSSLSNESSFSTSVREQEYSLVDRVTTALGTSVMSALLNGEGFADMSPRQYHMARALATSIADVYECVAIDGNRVNLRSLRDGRTYAVYEHMEPIRYAVGWLGFGRLLPFDDTGLHLRSPGMNFTKPLAPDFAHEVSDALRRYEEGLPAALAVEAVISSIVLGVSVPRRDRPMRSRADARRTLDALRQIFAGTEWEDVLTPSNASAHPAKAIGVPQYYVPHRQDTTVDEFMTALIEQAEAGSGNVGRLRAEKPKRPRRWR